jgi:hypothetical protein
MSSTPLVLEPGARVLVDGFKAYCVCHNDCTGVPCPLNAGRDGWGSLIHDYIRAMLLVVAVKCIERFRNVED